MNVVSKPNLFSAARSTKNVELVEKVVRWHELAKQNNFASFVELKGVFPTADLVGDKVVFNLGAYRLVCGVSFLRRAFFFKALLNHGEYDRGGWKR